MDLHYFTENYKYSPDPRNLVLGVLPYYDFEKNMIDDFLNHQMVAIAKGRQMHATTLLATYAAWLLITKENYNIGYCTVKSDTNYRFIEKVKTIINHYNEVNNYGDEYYIKNTAGTIIYGSDRDHANLLKTFNGNGMAPNSLNANVIMFDELALIKNSKETFSGFISELMTNGQIIAVSTPNGTKDEFYDTFVNKPKFSKRKVTWRDNPRYDKEWAENMRKNLGSELAYKEQIEAAFIDHDEYKEQKKKSNLIQVRLDDEMMKQIGYRLIEKDTNISNYIRGLIDKDINS